MDRLTQLTYFLAVRMTFTMEEFYRLYIHEIVWFHGVSVSMVSDRDPRFKAHFWKSFLVSHGDIIDEEHNFSSPNRQSVRVDLPDVRGHASGMRP